MKALNKKIQKSLYEYKSLDIKNKSIKIDIENLENNIILKALNEKEKLLFNVPLVNEDEYIQNEITRLRLKLKFNQGLKDKIENALKVLSSRELLLIQLRYFEKSNLSWSQMNYEDLKKLINNVIENEFRTVEREDFQRLDEEVLDEYTGYTRKITGLQHKILDGLTEELQNDFSKFEELITRQLCIEIKYYFKRGVVAGTTNLNFLRDTGIIEYID